MAIQLALLLLGPSHFKYEWKRLFAFGLTLVTLGVLIVWDASDRTSYLVIDALGFLLLGAGLLEGAYCARSGWDHSTPFKLSRAVTLAIIGLVIVCDPVTMKHIDALLLGSTFIALGLFKLFFSLLCRYPHWKIIVLGGALNVIVGSLFFVQWEGDKHWILPLLFGCMFIMMGAGALSNAWALRSSRLLSEDRGDAISALDHFLRYHVSPRYRPAFARLPHPKKCAETPAAVRACAQDPAELMVHIWMPQECAKDDLPLTGNIPILNRYLLVRDKGGCLTVGHSSLQMKPDLYISHTDRKWYQKVKNAEKEEPEDFRFFEQIKAHDEEGSFFESYEEEARCWMPATRTIKIPRFNETYLRLFDTFYKMDSTYNLAVRNCSVCVVMALDMALLGCLRGRSMTIRFLKLIFDKDLWLAHFIAKRAEDMAWSPGLVYDYAVTMNRLVERHLTPREAD